MYLNFLSPFMDPRDILLDVLLNIIYRLICLLLILVTLNDPDMLTFTEDKTSQPLSASIDRPVYLE